MLKNEKGQGLTEYVIIVALIAVAAVSVIKVFGETVRVNFAKMTAKLQDGKYSGSYSKVTSDGHVKRKGFSDMDK